MAKTTSSSSPSRLTAAPRKERLFEDFFTNMIKTTERIENLFAVTGVKEQVFGCDQMLFSSDDAQAKDRVRNGRAWAFLSELYDYAVEGIDRTNQSGSTTDGTSSLVIDAGEIIALLTGEEGRISKDWQDIVKMGDGRFALEDGQGLDVERVALLANVDVRTVRNAMSSGALVSITHDEPSISNESARLWLMGRKGFKPTVVAGDAGIELACVRSVDRFGAFLRQRHVARQQALASDTKASTSVQEPLLDAYPGLTKAILDEVESGVFRVPLNMTRPLADFYGVARDEFLECVMQVFFPEELEVLSARVQRGRLRLVSTSPTPADDGSLS